MTVPHRPASMPPVLTTSTASPALAHEVSKVSCATSPPTSAPQILVKIWARAQISMTIIPASVHLVGQAKTALKTFLSAHQHHVPMAPAWKAQTLTPVHVRRALQEGAAKQVSEKTCNFREEHVR